MSYIPEMLKFNENFVKNKGYEKFRTTKFPDKKVAILSCMDTRLTNLLPAALNIQYGDIKIIKNAGALISHPFGSVMRSLVVAIYELGVKEIFVIGHSDCGMENLNSQQIIEKMLKRGIRKNDLDLISSSGVNTNTWLTGFSNPIESVKETVKLINNHPLIPKDVSVMGFIINPTTGCINLLKSI